MSLKMERPTQCRKKGKTTPWLVTEATSCKGFSVIGANVIVRMMRLAVNLLCVWCIWTSQIWWSPNQHISLLEMSASYLFIFSILYKCIFGRFWTCLHFWYCPDHTFLFAIHGRDSFLNEQFLIWSYDLDMTVEDAALFGFRLLRESAKSGPWR